MMPEAKAADASVRHVTVTAADAGRRIDNFLGSLLKGVPRRHLYRLLRRGEIRVNGRRIGPEHRVEAHDEVRIPPIRLDAGGAAPRIPEGLGEALLDRILYEDRQLLVLDKPAGVPVHAGSGLSYGIIEVMRAMRPGAHLELVHRLDRATSGCLILAKEPPTLRALHRLIQTDAVLKRYVALVAGRLQDRRVDLPLGEGPERQGRRVMQVRADGKQAETRFRTLTRYATATCVQAEIGTGRTHQIRVHAAHIGHPVAGDETYGDHDFNRVMRAAGLRRMFLHAAELRIELPERREAIELRAPLPEDLQQVLTRLEQPGHARSTATPGRGTSRSDTRRV